ncbi:hypothetical protein E1B28_006541 [Marasmius oreades]|uniref:Pali-domain-containing protein n=1 Tax=Marasmius oreades TaxID=181124 RepID=A0A9P7S5I8_9AGAR|nr:uncharacterized protein E1B28_006541 [Marasmius oreades]KAG7095846.1 hypothetical protein E1B28_006541 [Marasmius oreades]
MTGKDIPAVAFCLVATVLLLVVCISTPTWDSVFFMEAGTVTSNSTAIRFGTFGYSHSNTSIGYRDLDLWTLGISSNSGNENKVNAMTVRLESLSKAMILHPIAVGLGGLSILSGTLVAEVLDSGTALMAIFFGLAMVVAFVAWIVDMALFGFVSNQLSGLGIHTEWGNATWLVLVAFVAFLVGFILITTEFGMCVGPRKKGYQAISRMGKLLKGITPDSILL